MARKRERIFALVGALLFFVTSFGLTGLVLWTMHQQSRAQKAADAAQHVAACNNSKPPKAADINVTEKGMKLQDNPLADFTPCKVDKLQSIDVTTGTGDVVKPGDTVTVDYTGAVANTGTVFQSSLDSGQKATFGLAQVIPGWTEGIPGMKVGGKRRLLIPAAQAYGASPPQGSNIPANADLVFDITLYKIGS